MQFFAPALWGKNVFPLTPRLFNPTKKGPVIFRPLFVILFNVRKYNTICGENCCVSPFFQEGFLTSNRPGR